jgi:hypothetical protein
MVVKSGHNSILNSNGRIIANTKNAPLVARKTHPSRAITFCSFAAAHRG